MARSNKLGKINILSLLGTGFLVLTLGSAVYFSSNPQIKQVLSSFAKKGPNDYGSPSLRKANGGGNTAKNAPYTGTGAVKPGAAAPATNGQAKGATGVISALNTAGGSGTANSTSGRTTGGAFDNLSGNQTTVTNGSAKSAAGAISPLNTTSGRTTGSLGSLSGNQTTVTNVTAKSGAGTVITSPNQISVANSDVLPVGGSAQKTVNTQGSNLGTGNSNLGTAQPTGGNLITTIVGGAQTVAGGFQTAFNILTNSGGSVTGKTTATTNNTGTVNLAGPQTNTTLNAGGATANSQAGLYAVGSIHTLTTTITEPPPAYGLFIYDHSGNSFMVKDPAPLYKVTDIYSETVNGPNTIPTFVKDVYMGTAVNPTSYGSNNPSTIVYELNADGKETQTYYATDATGKVTDSWVVKLDNVSGNSNGSVNKWDTFWANAANTVKNITGNNKPPTAP